MKTAFKILSLICIYVNSNPNIFAQKPELIIKTDHAMGTHCVAFSPDGEIIATASEDQTIKLWDASTGKKIRMQRIKRFTLMFRG